MKKAFAYAVFAAVLGIAVMLAPILPSLIVSTSTSAQTGGEDTFGRSPSPQSFAQETQSITKNNEASQGVVPNYPVDTMTVTMMLLLSLAVAVSAYFYVRRSRFLKNRNMPLQP